MQLFALKSIFSNTTFAKNGKVALKITFFFLTPLKSFYRDKIIIKKKTAEYSHKLFNIQFEQSRLFNPK